jgi:hypothetical protein
MNLLVLIVEDADAIEDFLSALVELDVAGMQVVDSSSVMGVLAAKTPIFAGLRQLVSHPRAESKMVFGVTEDDEVLVRLDRLLKKIGYDLDQTGVGYAFCLPLAGMTGYLEM